MMTRQMFCAAMALPLLLPGVGVAAQGLSHAFEAEDILFEDDNRFQVAVEFMNPGPGAVPPAPAGNPDDGLFHFFDTDNTEVLLKMIGVGPVPSAISNFVFYGARTSVGTSLTVTNTETMRIEIKTGVITPGGYRTASRSTFNQGFVIHNPTDAPINVGINFTGSHDASGVFATGPGNSTKHSFSVDVNDGTPGFIDFSKQGHFNSFNQNFNSTVGGLFPVGVTRPSPGEWEFDEAAVPIDFNPLTDPLLPGQTAEIFVTGSVEIEIINPGESLASYDGFNTTYFDFELSDPGLEIVEFSVIPEPSSLALLGIGGLCACRRRRD